MSTNKRQSRCPFQWWLSCQGVFLCNSSLLLCETRELLLCRSTLMLGIPLVLILMLFYFLFLAFCQHRVHPRQPPVTLKKALFDSSNPAKGHRRQENRRNELRGFQAVLMRTPWPAPVLEVRPSPKMIKIYHGEARPVKELSYLRFFLWQQQELSGVSHGWKPLSSAAANLQECSDVAK